MHKQNIADFILYDISRNHVQNGFGVNASAISEVVEGWNQNIYVTPSENIKFCYRQKMRVAKFN